MTVQVMQPEQAIAAIEGEFIALASSHNLVKWEAECNYAIQQIYKNNYSVGIAQKNPTSVQNAVRNVAAIGLTLNPVLKYAYLVPRDNMICLDISYMGLMHLAQDTGSVIWSQCKVVKAKDQYLNKGVSVEPEHSYAAFGDRGDIVGVYCIVKLADGDFLTHEMDIAAVYEIRNRSMAWKTKKAGPWATDEVEMIKKTCVKQASKYWPKVERLQQAITVLNDGGEGIDFDAEDKARTEASPDYQIAQQLIGHMSNADGEALLDDWTAIDQDEQEKVWRRLSAPDRREIKKLLSGERAERKLNEGETV
jgi:recombination protein RecT